MKSKSILKMFIFLIVLSCLGVFAYYLPYDRISQKIGILKRVSINTQLSISFKNGSGKIYIDDKEYGTTPQTINNLTPGLHKLKIQREVTSEQNFYKPFETYVPVSNHTETYVNIEIAPEGLYSGYIIYYEPAPTNKNGLIKIKSSINNLHASLKDTELQQENGLISLKPGEYKIQFSAEGYEPIEIPLIVRDGLTLVVNVNLLPIPINLSQD